MSASARSLLFDRNYAVYAFGNAISYLGTWAQRIAVGWLSWELSHQTFWVGVISLAQLLPLIVFGPLFGALLDRHDHRRFAVGVNLALAMIAAVLYVLTALHWMGIGLLGLMSLVLGIANAAFQAVRLAMINDVVEPQRLTEAIAINSLVYNVTRAVGPAVAGVVIAAYGIAAAFAVNAVSFGGILVALFYVQLRPRRHAPSTDGLWAQSRDGMRYVLEHPGLRQLVLLGGITALLARGVVELLPAFADGVYGRGSVGLANLTTAAGIGAIAGAFALSRLRPGEALLRLTRYSVLAMGAVVAIFGLCTSYAAGLLISTLIGCNIVLCSVALQVLLQSAVHDGFRGRVLGLWTAVNVAGPGLGGALDGTMAQWFGLQRVTVASGLTCVALVLWVMRGSRPLLIGAPANE